MAYVAKVEEITLYSAFLFIKTTLKVKSISTQTEPPDIRFRKIARNNISSKYFSFEYEKVEISSKEKFIAELEYRISTIDNQEENIKVYIQSVKR